MKIFKLVLVLSIIVLSSCSKNKIDDNDPVPEVLENYDFYNSAQLYNKALQLRSESYSDAFEIDNVAREGNFLNVTLSYQANCETEKFDVIWDGLILESWPMQIHLIIKRSASDCDLEGETITQVLAIDLVELISDEVLVDGSVFHISNSSKTSNEANADVTISNN